MLWGGGRQATSTSTSCTCKAKQNFFLKISKLQITGNYDSFHAEKKDKTI
jgi:hypothetical protein